MRPATREEMPHRSRGLVTVLLSVLRAASDLFLCVQIAAKQSIYCPGEAVGNSSGAIESPSRVSRPTVWPWVCSEMRPEHMVGASCGRTEYMVMCALHEEDADVEDAEHSPLHVRYSVCRCKTMSDSVNSALREPFPASTPHTGQPCADDLWLYQLILHT